MAASKMDRWHRILSTRSRCRVHTVTLSVLSLIDTPPPLFFFHTLVSLHLGTPTDSHSMSSDSIIFCCTWHQSNTHMQHTTSQIHKKSKLSSWTAEPPKLTWRDQTRPPPSYQAYHCVSRPRTGLFRFGRRRRLRAPWTDLLHCRGHRCRRSVLSSKMAGVMTPETWFSHTCGTSEDCRLQYTVHARARLWMDMLITVICHCCLYFVCLRS